MGRGKRTKTRKQDLVFEICRQTGISPKQEWKSTGSTVTADAFEAILCRIAKDTGIPPEHLEKHQKTIWRMLHKSMEGMVLALEIINKPSIVYRMECFLFLFINSWELLLKAKIIEDSRTVDSVNEPDNPHRTITFGRAVRTVFVSEKDAMRMDLLKIEDLRNGSAHFFIPIIPPNALQLFQAGILNYERKISTWFDRSLCEKIPKGMIFLVAELDPSLFTLDSPILSKQLPLESLAYLKEWQSAVREEIAGLDDNAVPLYAVPIHINLSVINNPSKADILSF
jgi:hypothetical protein